MPHPSPQILASALKQALGCAAILSGPAFLVMFPGTAQAQAKYMGSSVDVVPGPKIGCPSGRRENLDNRVGLMPCVEDHNVANAPRVSLATTSRLAGAAWCSGHSTAISAAVRSATAPTAAMGPRFPTTETRAAPPSSALTALGTGLSAERACRPCPAATLKSLGWERTAPAWG